MPLIHTILKLVLIRTGKYYKNGKTLQPPSSLLLFFFFLVSFCVSSLPITDLDFCLNTFMLHFLVSFCVSSLPNSDRDFWLKTPSIYVFDFYCYPFWMIGNAGYSMMPFSVKYLILIW